MSIINVIFVPALIDRLSHARTHERGTDISGDVTNQSCQLHQGCCFLWRHKSGVPITGGMRLFFFRCVKSQIRVANYSTVVIVVVLSFLFLCMMSRIRAGNYNLNVIFFNLWRHESVLPTTALKLLLILRTIFISLTSFFILFPFFSTISVFDWNFS